MESSRKEISEILRKEQGENDKRLAELLNKEGERLLDINIKLENRGKMPKYLKNQLYKSCERILRALRPPISLSAFDGVVDYLTEINSLLIKYN